jgi:hypothetical protein
MRRHQGLAATALFAVISILATGAARGGVLVGNLANAPFGSDAIDADDSRAQGFRTDGRDWNLTSIVAVLGGLGTSGAQDVTAMLVAATTNAQGESVPDLSAALATFDAPAIDSGFSALSFTSATSILLKANTEYWFVLSAGAGSASFEWQYTNDTSLEPGSAGLLTSAAAPIPPGSGAWRSQPNAPYLIQVNGTPVGAAVPEPSSWIAGGFGLSSVVFLVGRRRSGPAVRRR